MASRNVCILEHIAPQAAKTRLRKCCANRTLLGDASARQSWKAPDASDKGETYDDHDVIQLWDDFLCSATIYYWALGHGENHGTYRLPFLGVAFGAAHGKPLRDRK